MLRLSEILLVERIEQLTNLHDGKMLICSVNAHSYNKAQSDDLFAKALINSDYLIPDGISIVLACRWLKAKSRPA